MSTSTTSTTSTTFAFVDLSGFSALTQAHGDGEAISAVRALQARVREHLGPDDLFVKAIGDAVMLVFDSPTAAIDRLRRILSPGGVGTLRLRAGVHTGPAIRDGDDFYGHAVNVAARIAARAVGDELLVTAEVAGAAQQLGLTVSHVGSTALRNLADPVDLYRVRIVEDADEDAVAVDPVCAMRVPTVGPDAIGLRQGDERWWFCGLPCVARFVAHEDVAR